MISTDKAVNPTNVMGATKRMCEMIVLSRAKTGKTKYSATRFGHVLGSNGSVIPLFQRQIDEGGPVTITDRNIIRYFMTIPEASQLVMTSGAMADNGELFVLDMGDPVKILDLAEMMIRMNGFEPGVDMEIKEVGLRPGEKMYEELLVKGENLGKTGNEKIFTEKDAALSAKEMVPLGLLLPLLFYRAKHPYVWTVLIVLGLSVLTEVLQYLTRRGLCELDDLFDNLLGGLIGIGMLAGGGWLAGRVTGVRGTGDT